MQSHEPFHLSIGARSILDEADFFASVLGGRVTHEDPSGYVNLEVFGSQITLKDNPGVDPVLEDFHFGFNLNWDDFEDLSEKVLASGYDGIVMKPRVIDAGSKLERIKMYLRSPTGYLVELKGYKAPKS